MSLGAIGINISHKDSAKYLIGASKKLMARLGSSAFVFVDYGLYFRTESERCVDTLESL